MGVKILVAIVAAIALFFLGLLMGGVPFGLLFAIVGLVFGFIMPEFWLGGRIRKRSHGDDPPAAGRP